MRKQVRQLEPGDAFVWRGKRYVLEAREPSDVAEHYYAKRGKEIEFFLGGQEVELIVPEADGQLGLFGGEA